MPTPDEIHSALDRGNRALTEILPGGAVFEGRVRRLSQSIDAALQITDGTTPLTPNQRMGISWQLQIGHSLFERALDRLDPSIPPWVNNKYSLPVTHPGESGIHRTII